MSIVKRITISIQKVKSNILVSKNYGKTFKKRWDITGIKSFSIWDFQALIPVSSLIYSLPSNYEAIFLRNSKMNQTTEFLKER